MVQLLVQHDQSLEGQLPQVVLDQYNRQFRAATYNAFRDGVQAVVSSSEGDFLLNCVIDACLERCGALRYHGSTRTLRQPVSSSRYLTEALLRLLTRISVQTGICGLVVTLADLMPFAGQQLELFPDQPKPRERLQQRLSSLLTRSDAPECYWITTQDPAARRIEHRYGRERVVPL